MITDAELLEMASAFFVGYLPIVNGRLVEPEKHPTWVKRLEVYVKNKGNPDPNQPDRWGIYHGEFCLTKDGEWEEEPLNSNKTEDFYQKCRYQTAREAIEYFDEWYKAKVAWAKEELAKEELAKEELAKDSKAILKEV